MSLATIELASKPIPSGFAKVAEFLARDPDHSSGVFRRFDRLALRNLLHLQAKLASLEDQLLRLDDEESNFPDTNTTAAGTSWEDFERLAKDPTKPQISRRMELSDKIEVALKKYQEALMLHSGIMSMSKPPDTTLAAYKRFFKPDNGTTQLRKESRGILDQEGDLLAIHTSLSHDRLTSFVLNHMSWLFVTELGSTASVSAKSLARFVSFVSTIITATLLIGAVATLNYADPRYHMLILALYTAGFASTVVLLTSASRPEVFSASCAYVAVLVVFIGTAGGGTSPGLGSSV